MTLLNIVKSKKSVLVFFLFVSLTSMSQEIKGQRYALTSTSTDDLIPWINAGLVSSNLKNSSIMGYIDIYRFDGCSLTIYRKQDLEPTSFLLYYDDNELRYGKKSKVELTKALELLNQRIVNTDSMVVFLSKSLDSNSVDSFILPTSYWYTSKRHNLEDVKNLEADSILNTVILPDCISVGHPKSLFVALGMEELKKDGFSMEALKDIMEKPRRRRCRKFLKTL